MGLYLRKSFRAGPIRFNLSKSGLGLSAGVKGARLGIGPRGTYVHAGRNGLYYRKHLSSRQSRSRSNADGEGCAMLLLLAVAIGLSAWLFTWLIENPLVLVCGLAVAVGILILGWSIQLYRRNLLASYKTALDSAFVSSQSPPSAAVLADLRQQQERLPKSATCRREIDKIETDVYEAVLDRVLDDGFITKEEATKIAAAEQTLRLDRTAQLQTKKEIFSAAYVEAIQDREITKDELNMLRNLLAGLAIPKAEVHRELGIVQDIIRTHTLRLPFRPIPRETLAAPIQKSENAFYQCPAQVLSKRKSKGSPTGYEYGVRRDGTLVLTNKRVFVVGDGTTNIRFAEVADVDVDIDEGFIEISKTTSGRPILLKTAAPIFTGRAIDLLANAQADRGG